MPLPLLLGVLVSAFAGDGDGDGDGEGWEEGRRGAVEEGERLDVAMTRKVVRSKRMTSVALQLRAKVVRWRVRISALGMMVWTIRDHACIHS